MLTDLKLVEANDVGVANAELETVLVERTKRDTVRALATPLPIE